MSGRTATSLRCALGAGYVFLYLPIVLLVIYSFNDGRLVTVWSGFSTRWYGQLLANDRLLDAAALSLVVAATSASLATVVGTDRKSTRLNSSH